MLKTIACVLALSTSLAASLPATAADSRLVRYDDLNLANRAGMERLERRISAAAKGVCGANSTVALPLGEAVQTKSCIAKARASAREQIAALETDTALGG